MRDRGGVNEAGQWVEPWDYERDGERPAYDPADELVGGGVDDEPDPVEIVREIARAERRVLVPLAPALVVLGEVLAASLEGEQR